MRTLWLIALAACGGSTGSPAPVAPAPSPPAVVQPAKPPAHAWPATDVHAVNETVHGKTIRDPYRWLENAESPEVQRWMAAQDRFARDELAKSPTREAYAARLKQLYYYDAVWTPSHRGDRLFYARKLASQEKGLVYWKPDGAGAERVLLDPNQWSTDGSAGLGEWWPSWDGTYVAYEVKEHNADEAVMHVIDVATGKELPDVIPGSKYAATSWLPDGRGFYYTWIPPVSEQVTVAERPGFAEVRLHKLGTPPANDPVIYPATHNAENALVASVSRDGHWLIVSISHGWNSTDVYFRDLRSKATTWTPLVTGVDALFEVEAWHDQLYVKTNDGAPKYRVFKVDPRHPARAAWREIVAENEATLERAVVAGEHLVLGYLRNATSELEIHDLAGKLVRKLDLPPLGTVDSMSGRADDDTAYVGYTSFLEPNVVFKTSIKTGKLAEWARIKLPVDTSQLTAEQVFYPSKDGTKISMFLIHKKGTPRDGKNPTILGGYGGFNINETPAYASWRTTWLERGGVYALPNLRGGGEYGEAWHRGGMQLHKQNVFDDFIAAAEYLIAEKWTSRDHLAIRGGSNGGLLVGATLTQRPELFKAVLCAVPLLDMLRYHLFGEGKTWVPEYGSAEDAQQFAALYAYSPYRVAVDAGPRAYPAVLFDSSDHDDRVDPMHARKLAALLQATQTASAPILLRIEKNAGHGGADMVKSQVERTADELAWLDQLLR